MPPISISDTTRRTSEVPPHDRLELDDLRLAHQQRAARELRLPVRCDLRVDARRHGVERGGDDVVVDDVLQAVEPEDGDLGEELSFVRDALHVSESEWSMYPLCEQNRMR